MFVDEVRAQMPSNTYLDQIKHNIMEIAKDGGREYIIDRYDKSMELKEELEWLKNEGFNVEVWGTRHSFNYYPSITVSW